MRPLGNSGCDRCEDRWTQAGVASVHEWECTAPIDVLAWADALDTAMCECGDAWRSDVREAGERAAVALREFASKAKAERAAP